MGDTVPQKAYQWLQKTLVGRVSLFVVLFVLISGLSGSWLISTQKLFYPFHFWIYGSAGKVLLFSVLSFFLLARETLRQGKLQAFNRWTVVFLGVAAGALAAFFPVAGQLFQYRYFMEAPVLALVAHALLWVSVAAAGLAALGVEYVRWLVRTCRRPLVISLVMAVIFYAVFSYVYTLWPYLSAIVLWAVVQLLKVTNPGAMVIPPLTIHLPQFAVTIGEYCSGIESLFLSSALYVLIGCLEWRRLKKREFILGYFLLIIGMFALNIVRVFAIIQAGVLLSPQIAAKLFHTYLGMILFMTYFVSFWRWYAPKALVTPHRARKK